MKKLLLPLLVAAMLLCIGCAGPEGPMGPQGTQGDVGTSGQPGEGGADGQDGTNGQDGQDGQDGTDGRDGEPGTPGADGRDGEDGAGTRIVYTSAAPISTWGEVYFLIPEITLNDMPLVAVYAASKNHPNEWMELPVYFDLPKYSAYCYFTEGRIYVGNCLDMWIKMVIVT